MYPVQVEIAPPLRYGLARLRRAFEALALCIGVVASPAGASAAQRVIISWNRSIDSSVVGYTVVYGPASGTYTNQVWLGNVTNVIISGLIDGGTYYFAATDFDGEGQESALSDEVVYVAPGGAPAQPPTVDTISDLVINENDGVQGLILSGITGQTSNGNTVVMVTATSSNPELVPDPVVIDFGPNDSRMLMLNPAVNGSGVAMITVTVDNGQASNNIASTSFAVTVSAVNQPPTLDLLSDLTVNENGGFQSVPLTGITAGPVNEIQDVTIRATSSNPALVPNPVVWYANPNTSGLLVLTPAADGFGSAEITVTVDDGQGSNSIVSQSFTVTVKPVDEPPTIDLMSDLAIDQNDGLEVIILSGITAGPGNALENLRITASSSNPGLIPNPTVYYTGLSTEGTLTFSAVENGFGTAVITVTLDNGKASNNIVTSSFMVRVNGVNQPPTLDPLSDLTIYQNIILQGVILSGITAGSASEIQDLTVTATSSNPLLVANPTVQYVSPHTSGVLVFGAPSNGAGTAVVTVTVNDGQASNNTFSHSFTVTVMPLAGGNGAAAVTTVTDNTGAAGMRLTAKSLRQSASSLRTDLSQTAVLGIEGSPAGNRGAARVVIHGTVGRTYRLESCQTPGATNWQYLAEIGLKANRAVWVDGKARLAPTRFYRAVLLPAK